MPRRRPAAWPFLLFCLSALAAPAAFSQVLTVGDSPQPLVMDGHLKDWPASRMITLDDPGQVVEGGFFWKGPDQFGARVFLTYDAEYLYLAVLVTREGPPVNSNKPSALWNGDCLELFLSTDPGFASQGRLTRADYHVGISPGTDCQDPQAWCFNLEEAIPGSQVTAKISKKGYLMEAALPLDFFRGLEIAPGGICGFDLALDEGGPVGGNRLARMDYSGHRETWLHPAGWTALKWTGATHVKVPPPNESDENAILVRDGTRGAGFLGKKTFTGRVVDDQGRPLPGAEVSLWPADGVTVTDGSGDFALGPAKAYRKTLLYARHDGYFTGLAAPQAGERAVTLRLSSMPVTAPGPRHARGPLSFGAGFSLDAAGQVPADLPVSLVRGLGLGFLYLRGGCLEGSDDEAQKGALTRFQDYARALGAEPMVEVPWGPDAASRAVSWWRDLRSTGGTGVRYWSLGDAPDLAPQGSAYDYVNDFREFFNALKQEDPSVIVMGPNLAFPDGRSGTEWMGAFLRYDGDIVNLASVQHYACGAVSQLSPGGLWDDVRGLTPAYRALQGRVCQDSDLYLPVVYTRMGLYPGTDAPEDFTQTLWRAEVLGTLLQEGAEMMVAGDLEGPGKTGLFAQGVPDPAARVLELFSAVWKGIPVPAKAKKNGIDVFAAQDPVTRDLSLFIVNRNTRYEWMDVSLDGHGDNLVVEAGLSRRFRLEVPDQALVAVRAPADGSPVTVEVYGAAQAKKGGGPLSETLRP